MSRFKKFILIPSGLAITILAVTKILIPFFVSYYTTEIKNIDNDFRGIKHALENGKNVRLLIVHGIGKHCIGYSDQLVRGLVNELGLTSKTTFSSVVKEQAEILKKQQDKIFKQLEIFKQLQQKKYEDLNPDFVPINYPINYLMDDNCQKIKSNKNIEEKEKLDFTGYNDFENRQQDTCKAINQKLPNYNATCEAISLSFQTKRENSSANEKPETRRATLGFIKTQEYKNAQNEYAPTLRVYELTWDLTTRWAKGVYVFKNDRQFDKDRASFNEMLKNDVVNDSISDAVIYLGNYNLLMKYPILMAFCKIASDSQELSETTRDEFNPLKNGDRQFICNFQDFPEFFNLDDSFSDKNEVVIITHSLGTRMLFDTLGLVRGENFYKKIINDLICNHEVYYEGIVCDEEGQLHHDQRSVIKEAIETPNSIANKLKKKFQKSITKIFALANQMPLLEMSLMRHPFDFYQSADNPLPIGKEFQAFIDERIENKPKFSPLEPLQIVSFSDPDDPLSYNLKCWYYMYIARNKYYPEIFNNKKYWQDDKYPLSEEEVKEKSKDLKDLNVKKEEIEKTYITAKELKIKYTTRLFEACSLKDKKEQLNKLNSTELDGRILNSKRELTDKDEENLRLLYQYIWKEASKSVSFSDVSVALKGIRIPPQLATHPKDVHSNYFMDKTTYKLIACGGNQDTDTPDKCF